MKYQFDFKFQSITKFNSDGMITFFRVVKNWKALLSSLNKAKLYEKKTQKKLFLKNWFLKSSKKSFETLKAFKSLKDSKVTPKPFFSKHVV